MASFPSRAMPRLQTSFLIPNLHCPTCVSHVTSLINDLDPSAAIRNISIVKHVVTVAHESATSPAAIGAALTAAGYEVFDIVHDTASTEKLSLPESEGTLLQRAVQRWDPRRHSQVDETTRLLHDANCQMCAASSGLGELEAITTAESRDPLSVATISVEGMTCSSCVGNVTKALQVPGVERADVSLIGHSATVHFRATESEDLAPQLVDAVEDAGYDAQLIKVEWKPSLQKSKLGDSSRPGKLATESPRRSVSVRIDGIHCPRCPERIIGAIRRHDIDIETPPTVESPILAISYTPSAPALTIRRIMSDICALDPSFTTSIHKPTTVEQRSREMLAREQKAIFLRALLTVVTAIPTLLIGVVYMNLVSETDPGYKYLMHPVHGVSRAEWATFAMATPVYIFATDYFHRRMFKELYSLWRPRSPVPIAKRFYRFGSMNMLISFGTTIAYFASLAQLILSVSRPSQDMEASSKMSYFDSVVFLTMFLLLGRLAEAHMKTKSGDAISALGNLRPTEAILVTVKDDNQALSTVEKVDVDLIDHGDTVRVTSGSSPPCDGTLVDGEANFDESSLTGESRLIHKVAGDTVYSGTINKGGAVTIRVSGPAGASMLDSIINIVREGQAKRAPMERIADLLTAYFVPVVVLIAILTWLVWLTLGLSGALPQDYLDSSVGGWPFWSLQFAIAVFVIACPCGLGLAAPTALFCGGGIAATRGILVKGGGEAFQEASTLDAVIFDKTGTLTEGVEPKIVHHAVFDADSNISRPVVLGVLKAVEENSNHPLAVACVRFVEHESEVAAVSVTAVDEIAGKGLKANFESSQLHGRSQYEILVGNESLMDDYGLSLGRDAHQSLTVWKSSGYSVVLLASRVREGPWGLNGIFAASDPLRPEAAEVVASLQARGIDVWMLSGDNPSTANAVGKQVGIAPENIIAGVLPAQKAAKVKYLQQSLRPTRGTGFHSALSNGRTRATVAMVGDGINDAPALAAADVGIAVASGSDVAVQSASFILVHSNLRAVLTLVSLSRVVFRRVILNFFWAALYNMIALPVAAGVLYPATTSGGTHVRLDPAWAALAMALSSITVVASSLLLRTKLPVVGFRE